MQKFGTIPIIRGVLDKVPHYPFLSLQSYPLIHFAILILLLNISLLEYIQSYKKVFLTFWASNLHSNLRVLFERHLVYGRGG